MPEQPERFDPVTTRLLTFHDHIPHFLDGSDTPRAYLERCVETIGEREPDVAAFASLNIEGARAAADASSARYREETPLSPIDGMPIGIKDLFETEDMPTGLGSPLFKNRNSGRDAAVVDGLRRAGAIILGKTVTTEFGFYNPGPTRNPFDLSRTPGGSSSGSGAAVGARLVPVAIGSQVVGSLIRPSSFNANFGFKPSFGAINRGGAHSNLSQTVLGTQAGSLSDAWIAARVAAQFAGGDPGHVGLTGSMDLPGAVCPASLARLDTPGWQSCPPAVQARFDEAMAKIAQAGVTVLSQTDDDKIAAFEKTMDQALTVTNDICGYEFLWPLKQYEKRGPDAISENIATRLRTWERIDRETYTGLLAQRDAMRAAQMAFEGSVSAFITLSATGAAPVGLETTGDPVFAVCSSILGAPAINLPLLEVDGMPLGFQIIGYPTRDEDLFAIAHWILDVFGRDA